VSTTTFDLKNPHTGHPEKVAIPSECPTCNWKLSLSVPDEQGRVRLRCNTCGYDRDYVPFPESGGPRPGPTLTPAERRAVHIALFQAELYDLADKFA
jgi:hypothetical protein